MNAPIGTDIETAAHLLREGKLVAIPTETVYGLAANALNEEAVLRVFKAKKRPNFDPLIVHAASKNAAFQWATAIPEKANLLADTFWPGPLTLILPKKPSIPYVVSSGLDTVGLRVPRHSHTQKLLELLDFPLAAPSANPFGYISPTEASHVLENLGGEIDYILDGGACTHGLESTIIGFEQGEPVLYRRGSLPKSEIEKVIGPIAEKINTSSNPQAPGQLAVHYAPQKKLLLVNPNQEPMDEDFTLITFGNNLANWEKKAKHILQLSQESDSTEAARKLYGTLREADKLTSELIIISYLPEGNLSAAINDRLKRAASL